MISDQEGGGGEGGVVECNMTVTCPFLLNTGNRYSLFGEKLHFNTLFGNYQNYQIMDGAQPSHVVTSFPAQRNKKSEALILFTKLIDAGSLLSLASFLAQTSLGARNKSAQHFLSIELAFLGESNFYSGK